MCKELCQFDCSSPPAGPPSPGQPGGKGVGGGLGLGAPGLPPSPHPPQAPGSQQKLAAQGEAAWLKSCAQLQGRGSCRENCCRAGCCPPKWQIGVLQRPNLQSMVRGSQRNSQPKEQVHGAKVTLDCSWWHGCRLGAESYSMLQTLLLLTHEAKLSPVRARWQVLGRGTLPNLHMHHWLCNP